MATLFLDFETTSRNRLLKSVNPHHNCWVAGFSYAIDDSDPVYIDVHRLSDEDQNSWKMWLRELLWGGSITKWVNQNIKYDMHVLSYWLGEDLPDSVQYVCTMEKAKLYDSDRFTYNLTVLARDWLGVDISQYEKDLQMYLPKQGRYKNLDYGAIPYDKISVYANCDVSTTRKLYYWLLDNLTFSRWSEVNEEQLTYVLYLVERHGLPTEASLLVDEQISTVLDMLTLYQKLEKHTWQGFDPSNTDDLQRLILTYCRPDQLVVTPITEKGGGGNVSFSEPALLEYAGSLRLANKSDIVDDLLEWRGLNVFNNLFLTPWQAMVSGGRLHPTYNQNVTTGRLSCSEPNSMNLNKRAKSLIRPPEGYSFISTDLSQIEFRIIAHYIGQQDIIQAYVDNPDTDFHQWVADMCGIKRKPAKTVNFGMGYSIGKAKLIKSLAADKSIIEKASGSANFELAVTAIAESTIQQYHSKLHQLRPTIKAASSRLKEQGFLRNWYGRVRKMPVFEMYGGQRRDVTYRGFNNLCQSSAADLVKWCMAELYKRLRGSGVHMLAQVHDEILLMAPLELARGTDLMRVVLTVMESNPSGPNGPLSVPIRATYGVSETSWADASSDENSVVRMYEKLDHLPGR
jgi:DNA polymerase-1